MLFNATFYPVGSSLSLVFSDLPKEEVEDLLDRVDDIKPEPNGLADRVCDLLLIKLLAMHEDIMYSSCVEAMDMTMGRGCRVMPRAQLKDMVWIPFNLQALDFSVQSFEEWVYAISRVALVRCVYSV